MIISLELSSIPTAFESNWELQLDSITGFTVNGKPIKFLLTNFWLSCLTTKQCMRGESKNERETKEPRKNSSAFHWNEVMGTFTGHRRCCLHQPSVCEVSWRSRLTGGQKECYPQFPYCVNQNFFWSSRVEEEGAGEKGGEENNKMLRTTGIIWKTT